MLELTADGRRIVADVAARHAVSADTVRALLGALAAGGGSQAQFNIAELGGMGQWSRGGMLMIGDMFNNALKARVDALCIELSGLVGAAVAPRAQVQSQGGGAATSLFVAGGSDWWPQGLGSPASVGAQNDMRYAFFPQARRLAIAVGGQVSIYDTGDHRITGFSQQQSGDRSLILTSQHGLVRVADLARADAAESGAAAPAAEPVAPSTAGPAPAASSPEDSVVPGAAAPAATGADDVFAKIERLAELRARDFITEQEYQTKKSELLSRI